MLHTQILFGLLAGAAHAQVADPVPNYYNMADPRVGKTGPVGVVAFYYPGYNTPWDKKSQAGFLGNFWSSPLTVHKHLSHTKGGPVSETFQNAEAAFQALKWWHKAHEFKNLKGGEAFDKKKKLSGEDKKYAGYGNNWNGMWAVLQAKFLQPDGITPTYLGNLLKKTGDAYLLEHNKKEGVDSVWSDNKNGTGTNWLGMQLMLLRDQMTGKTEWTNYINTFFNVSTGWWINFPKSKNDWVTQSVGPAAALAKTPTPMKPTPMKPTPKTPTKTDPTGTDPTGTDPTDTDPTDTAPTDADPTDAEPRAAAGADPAAKRTGWSTGKTLLIVVPAVVALGAIVLGITLFMAAAPAVVETAVDRNTDPDALITSEV